MKKKRKPEKLTFESNAPAAGLGDLLKQAGFEASAPTDAPSPPSADNGTPDRETASAGPIRLPKRLAIRRERKGRGGKTVTLVEGLALTASALETLAKQMRKALGCGVRVEGRSLVLQGDMVDRARAWLDAERDGTGRTGGNIPGPKTPQ